MRPARVHTRIVHYPFTNLMQGARLDSIQFSAGNLVLDIHGFQQTSAHLFERDGRLFEQATGDYIPSQVCFSRVTDLKHSEFLTELENVALEDPSRVILSMYSWQQPGYRDIFYIIYLGSPASASMRFFARAIRYQPFEPKIPITVKRDWSPAPPMPGRLVPRPAHLHGRFGGDPITIKVQGVSRHRRLFIGGLEVQPKQRPQVEAVLNLCERASRWVRGDRLPPTDRAVNKGEGPGGMTISEILEEAEWVVERLEQNQRVLVHCVAGMNRSVTICCAALMLLEGLGAEAALERVREHHPWARPDSHHWLALRWLEINKKE